MMQYLRLFIVFAKIGFISFGGGIAMIPVMGQELSSAGWISNEEFGNIVAVSQMLPGALAINSAVYVGLSVKGILGAVVAAFAVSLPCFTIVLIMSHFLEVVNTNKLVNSIFKGIRPVTIGLIASAVVILAQMSIFSGGFLLGINIGALAIVAIAVFLNIKFKTNPILLIFASAIAGAFIC